jgi:mannose-6-phosphate isomerase-like protein (cupin superfamily)
MIERITHAGIELALIIPHSYKSEGIQFFTPNNYSQQIGYMSRPKGYVIEPHVHLPLPREVYYTQEVLFIRSGRVRVDFYDSDGLYLQSRILEQGDFILLAAGGHGFVMLEPSEMIEVKQGPYAGEKDKSRFKSPTPERLVFKPQCP